ncbi:MAG TPA: hypothetical protein VNQ76_09190 [Planctomicrobium sp.]|nr:hypothetical protein [Planctomicrobium sp.]
MAQSETLRPKSQSSSKAAVSSSGKQEMVNPLEDTLCYLRTYAKEKPEVAALWCFGVGFILGWKLKPW